MNENPRDEREPAHLALCVIALTQNNKKGSWKCYVVFQNWKFGGQKWNWIQKRFNTKTFFIIINKTDTAFG